MNSVSGLVLSMGEKTTTEAIKRLKNQTCPVKEIILIQNVSPWAKAFVLGVSKVHTDFFINCNADMLSYPNCIERLSAYMKNDVGLVMGGLKDPLCGTIGAIKLYRTESLNSLKPKENSPTPDVDLAREIKQNGWKVIFANKDNPQDYLTAEVLGLHEPEYTPIYTYKKFKHLGIRITKGGLSSELRAYWDPLKESIHPMAKIGIVALSLGLLCASQKNMLDFSDIKEEFLSIKDLINRIKITRTPKTNATSLFFLKEDACPELLFKRFFRVGKELRLTLAMDKFNDLLGKIVRSENLSYCFGAIGLCYGFFNNPDIINIDKEWLKISRMK